MEKLKNKLVKRKQLIEEVLTFATEPKIVALLKGELLGIEIALNQIQKEVQNEHSNSTNNS